MAINTSNTLLDNSDQFLMVDYLTALLRDEQHTELKIATGYWDLPGTKLLYEPLKEFFERGGKLDLLIGQEPILRAYQLDENALHSIQEGERQYPGFYLRRDVEKLNADYQPTAQLLIDHINPTDEAAGQMRVHIYGKEGAVEFLHAKCYIFLGCGAAKAIVGSSNFTQHGLEDNAELNHMETSTLMVSSTDSYYSNTKSHLVWFNEKWDNSTPWNEEFIQILQKVPPVDDVIIAPLTPYEVYIRMLQDRFDVIVDDTMDKPLQGYLQGTTYQVQPYQLAAVKHCYYKMCSMGGFLLGDVVGLGKTIEALLLVCYFVENHEEWRSNRVLIIAPPAVLNSWRDSVEALDKANPALSLNTHIDFLSSGGVGNLANADLAEEQKDYEAEDDGKDIDLEYNTDTNYGLILIDESHKFRNRHTRMYESLEDLISGINSRTGYYPYIGLLSATPQNNEPGDIENQILLFEHQPRQSRFDSIPRRDLDAFFTGINKQYKALTGLSTPQAKQNLIALAKEVREKILDSIMVRRTRADITQVYGSAFPFPDVVGPVRLDYIMDPTLAQLFSDTMDAIGRNGTLQYARYRAIEYLTPANQRIYTQGSMTAAKSADALAGIIQILLVKRLESSFAAFIQSLRNQKRYIENMLQMIADDCIFICPDLDVNAELANASTFAQGYANIRTKMAAKNKGKAKANNNEFHKGDFSNLPKYEKMLQQDWQIVNDLLNGKDGWKAWAKSNPDPKLEEFKQRLTNEIMQPDSVRLQKHIVSFVARYPIATQTPGQQDEYKRLLELQKTITPADKGKLVIFSEAIDTVKQLESVCTALGYRVLAVTAANRKLYEPIIKANFDANCPKDEQQDDYDIIITTEVLSEGINLHRANAIVNYDTPWNATKLIQRIGRVNRIGSVAKAVFVYNFFPSAKGNTYIHLVQNAYAKLQSFHVMFGEDHAIFSTDEEVFSYSAVLNGVPDPEQVYLKELRDYKNAKPLRYTQIKAAPTPLAAAISDTPNTAVCAVKDKETMYYQVDLNAQTLVATDMLRVDAFAACKCAPGTSPCPLPANLQDINTAALTAYHLYKFGKHSKTSAASKVVQEAMKCINDWQKTYPLAQDVQDILTAIATPIACEDKLLAGSVVAIGKDIDDKVNTPFPYTAQDMENAIRDKLSKPAEQAKASASTTAYNFITMIK